MRSVQQLLHATTEELLERFLLCRPCWSVNKHDKYVRQSPASKDVNMKDEGPTAMEAISRWLVKTQQAEKTYVCALVNCKVYELVKWL
jgi:hypothetical protein